jgi:hypothetical protein
MMVRGHKPSEISAYIYRTKKRGGGDALPRLLESSEKPKGAIQNLNLQCWGTDHSKALRQRI